MIQHHQSGSPDRDTAPAADFASKMEDVTRTFLGEPNCSLLTKRELRFGNKGSLAVNLARETFYDHQLGEGSGVLDLIEREIGLTGHAAFDWLNGRAGAEIGAKRRQDRPSGRSRNRCNPEIRSTLDCLGGVCGTAAR